MIVQLRCALTVEGVNTQTRRRSRVSRIRMHSRTAQWTKQITGYSHGDRPQMAIADVHHTCHIVQVKCTRNDHYTASPSPQFAGSQRGRKRLSREATRHTVLALEWLELVQIGRCKVHWLISAVNKRNQTSFC